MKLRPLATVAFSLALLATFPLRAAEPVALRSVAVAAVNGVGQATVLDAVVEAGRQTVIAAQVQGAIVALPVKAGDTVKAGQLLLRLDARGAQSGVDVSQAQLEAAKALAAQGANVMLNGFGEVDAANDLAVLRHKLDDFFLGHADLRVRLQGPANEVFYENSFPTASSRPTRSIAYEAPV